MMNLWLSFQVPGSRFQVLCRDAKFCVSTFRVFTLRLYLRFTMTFFVTICLLPKIIFTKY